MRLEGKIAVVTGGARGIGLEIARRFYEEGASLVLADVQVEGAQQAALELDPTGTRTMAVATDVTKSASVVQLFEQAVARFGRVDILVNNAGITLDARLVKMTEEQFDTVIAINLKGCFLCGQAAALQMTAQGQGGAIINMTSVVGVYGNFGQSNYVATKSGLIGMTKTWAKELGKYGIRSNAVAPGFIRTPMTEKMPPEVLDGMKMKCPMKELGTPRHIADACLFLASEEAAYVNGITLEVTGGLTL